MNKFGIKLYEDGIYHIDEVGYNFNSIKHHNKRFYNNGIIKFRVIDYTKFGIVLNIKK